MNNVYDFLKERELVTGVKLSLDTLVLNNLRQVVMYLLNKYPEETVKTLFDKTVSEVVNPIKEKVSI